jgi:fatty acid desaturase
MTPDTIAGDLYDRRVEKFLDPTTVKALSQLKPWRGLLQIVLEWLAIAGAIALCGAYWNSLLYVATVAWIGARQGGLAVLMHEATHYRLLGNRKANDWLGEVLTAWPILITIHGYRQTHFAHHRHVNRAQDPDWQRKLNDPGKSFPKDMRTFIVITLKYWLGYYAVLDLVGINGETRLPFALQACRLVFYVSVIIASIVFQFWVGLLLYWLVPLLTYFWWVVYVRGLAEHFAAIESDDDLLQKTRHVEPTLVGRLMLAPSYIYAHVAHHLYPSVPFYNLGELQRQLMKNPAYAQRVHVTRGYLGMLRECLQSQSVREVS